MFIVGLNPMAQALTARVVQRLQEALAPKTRQAYKTNVHHVHDLL